MKALIAKSPNVLEFIETPKPKVGPNDVLAKVKYSGICATDIAIITGKTSFVESGLVKYPVRIGHEWSGIVEEVGSEVTNINPGDHVVADDGVPCFKCKACMAGNYNLCPFGKGVGTVNCWDGSFAEYIVMPSQLVHKLENTTDLAEAAILEPACIAMNSIKQGKVRPGDKVLVIGTGAIGLCAVGLLHAIGATVILSGRRDSKLEYGRKMKADVLINARNTDLKEELKKATSDGRVDVVIETSGNIEVLNSCLDYVKAGGKIVLAGFYEQKLKEFDIDKLVINILEIIGVGGTPNLFPPVIEMLESGKVSFKPLITSIYPFEKMKEAVQTVIDNNDDRIKVLIEFE